MQNLETTKTKLERKKARLQIEEVKMKIKERKMRTRLLIELGGLVVKAELDHLPSNTLYGALLSLKDQLKENKKNTIDSWTTIGKSVFEKEQKQIQTLILNLESQPPKEITAKLRNLGLKWNFVRKEWYGRVHDRRALEETIKEYPHNIEIIQEV